MLSMESVMLARILARGIFKTKQKRIDVSDVSEILRKEKESRAKKKSR